MRDADTRRIAASLRSGVVIGILMLTAGCSVPAPSPSVHSPHCVKGGYIPAEVKSTPECKEVESPILIDCADPEYPKDIRQRHLQGKVVVSARVTADGVIEDFQVESSPWPELSQLALDAFRQWRYKPAFCRDVGKPVPASVTMTTTFTLG